MVNLSFHNLMGYAPKNDDLEAFVREQSDCATLSLKMGLDEITIFFPIEHFARAEAIAAAINAPIAASLDAVE